MDKFLNEYHLLLAAPIQPTDAKWFYAADKKSLLWFLVVAIFVVGVFGYVFPQIRLNHLIAKAQQLQNLTLYQYDIILKSATIIRNTASGDAKLSDTRKKIYFEAASNMQRWVAEQKQTLPTPERMNALFKQQNQAYQAAQAILAASPLRVIDDVATQSQSALDKQAKEQSNLDLLEHLFGRKIDDAPLLIANHAHLMEPLPITITFNNNALDEVDQLLKSSYDDNQKYQAAKKATPAPLKQYDKLTFTLKQWFAVYNQAQKHALEAVQVKLSLSANPAISLVETPRAASDTDSQSQLDSVLEAEQRAKVAEVIAKSRSQQRAAFQKAEEAMTRSRNQQWTRAQKAAAANAEAQRQRAHDAWCNENLLNKALCVAQSGSQ